VKSAPAFSSLEGRSMTSNYFIRSLVAPNLEPAVFKILCSGYFSSVFFFLAPHE